MNAIQSPRPPLHSVPNRRVAQRPRRNHRRRSYQVIALETTAKLAVNFVISAGAVSALVQLMPYHWLQQEKLREINTEVKQIEGRVNRLQTEFSRNFDPQQARNIMQEQSHRIDPNQRQVVLMDKVAPQAEELESAP